MCHRRTGLDDLIEDMLTSKSGQKALDGLCAVVIFALIALVFLAASWMTTPPMIRDAVLGQ